MGAASPARLSRAKTLPDVSYPPSKDQLMLHPLVLLRNQLLSVASG